MANPRCPHCGGRTDSKGMGDDSIYYLCQATGCRMTVVLRRDGIPTTSGPCVAKYRDGRCPHTKED